MKKAKKTWYTYFQKAWAYLIQVNRLFGVIDRLDANVVSSLHNEDEAGSTRAETRGHPRKLAKNRCNNINSYYINYIPRLTLYSTYNITLWLKYERAKYAH